MKIYTIHTKQRIPISKIEAWEFLSDPKNLKVITPDYMGFHIKSGAEKEMYAGQIIEYIVTPVLGIKTKWVTEITHVKAKSYFVDEQRFGPYALWHHKHFINEVEGGVEMEDLIHYKIPFGFLGQWLHPLLVKPKLEEIFNYRQIALENRFGKL
ncbi:SRPBCC family protein [Ulvibacter antarcticus]|uniref:Ligand-binding SRPBCC domain-containing protein n=1 Tax=Ulvibacter antarcticus TaxID=442714 RepID=A0A3L9YVP2_9FLAO|nr:SRPBCC family protein [Ulvibacter antarcticus]RMA64583.1 ligand-binding SRPBCC domain-containing protein [Ulvibacter antarcticus]